MKSPSSVPEGTAKVTLVPGCGATVDGAPRRAIPEPPSSPGLAPA
jgi:hypothetical protein